MLAHGIARSAGIGKPDRFGAAAAARRSHNLLICPPSPAAYRLRGRCNPIAPQQRFAGSPSHSPPRHTWAGHSLTWWLHRGPRSALRVMSRSEVLWSGVERDRQLVRCGKCRPVGLSAGPNDPA